MRAIIYVRVSTAGQEKEGASLAEQERRCTQWIEMKGYKLIRVYKDVGSGFSMDSRESFMQMMEDTEEWDIVVAYKLDRFHRNMPNAVGWGDHLGKIGKNFCAIDLDIDTSSAMGLAFFRIMAVLNQLERDMTSERTKMGLKGVQNDGRWVGQPPYGYMIDTEGERNGLLLTNEKEAELVMMIYDWHEQGNLTISAICECLVKSGLRTRENKHIWQYMTVKRILQRREMYEGMATTPGGGVIRMPVILASRIKEEE